MCEITHRSSVLFLQICQMKSTAKHGIGPCSLTMQFLHCLPEKKTKIAIGVKKTPINEYKRTIIAQRTAFSFVKSALKIAVSIGKMCASEQAKRKARDENEEEQEVRKPTKRRTCWKHEADAS